MSVRFIEHNIDDFNVFRTPERYTDLAKIGSGSFGIVCSAVDTVGNRKVAIKQIKILSETSYQLKKVYREFHLMKLCYYHPGIVDLYEVFTCAKVAGDMKSIYIVEELMDVTLARLIKDDTQDCLTFDHISYITYQLVCGMKYLNSMEIMHRDLKPGNITIKYTPDSDIIVKIIDLGLARTFTPEGGSMTRGCVTLIYRAPELILNSGSYDKKIDIWSIACVLGYMLKKDHIFAPTRDRPVGNAAEEYIKRVVGCLGQPRNSYVDSTMLENELSRVQGGDPNVFVTELTQRFQDTEKTKVADAKDALLQMFKYISSDRIGINQLLQHDFFSGWRIGGGPEEVPPPALTSKVINFNKQFEKDKKAANTQQLKDQIFQDIRRHWPISPDTTLNYNYQKPYPVTALSVVRMLTPLVGPITYFSLGKDHSFWWRVGVSVVTFGVTLASVDCLRKIFN